MNVYVLFEGKGFFLISRHGDKHGTDLTLFLSSCLISRYTVYWDYQLTLKFINTCTSIISWSSRESCGLEQACPLSDDATKTQEVKRLPWSHQTSAWQGRSLNSTPGSQCRVNSSAPHDFFGCGVHANFASVSLILRMSLVFITTILPENSLFICFLFVWDRSHLNMLLGKMTAELLTIQ